MTHYENIPDELKQLNQWVAVGGNSKVPFNPYSGECASSVDPDTWSDYKTVESLFSKGMIDYCGFVFADNGIIGIDIDLGYDEDGFVSMLAVDIIGHCESYTEKSKSGRGFHILLRGNLPFKGRNNLAGVEIYKSSRYFIMTGNTLLYRTIEYNQAAIDYVIKRYFPETRDKKNGAPIGSRIYTPVWELPKSNRIKLRPAYPLVREGGRNVSMTSLAGMLHNIGYSKQQIYNELIYANSAACVPPLGRGELRSICNSVTRYKR